MCVALTAASLRGVDTNLLQLFIHLLYLPFHAADLRLTRLNLMFQLFDLEVEHELELFKLAERTGQNRRLTTLCPCRKDDVQASIFTKIRCTTNTSSFTYRTSWFFFFSSYIFFSFSPMVSSRYLISRLCAAISRSSPLIFCWRSFSFSCRPLISSCIRGGRHSNFVISRLKAHHEYTRCRESMNFDWTIKTSLRKQNVFPAICTLHHPTVPFGLQYLWLVQ